MLLFGSENFNKHSDTVSICMVRELSCNSENGGSEIPGEKGWRGERNTLNNAILSLCQTQPQRFASHVCP